MDVLCNEINGLDAMKLNLLLFSPEVVNAKSRETKRKRERKVYQQRAERMRLLPDLWQNETNPEVINKLQREYAELKSLKDKRNKRRREVYAKRGRKAVS